MLGQVDRRADDRDLGAAVGEARRGIGEIELDRFDGDLGVGGLEVADQAEQQIGAGADQIADAQHPAPGAREQEQVVDDGLHPRQRLVHLRQPRRTQVGQRDLTGVAVEEHHTELLLELLDRGGQRGLGDEQPFRGAAVVQLFTQHGEVAELPQRDVTHPGVGSPLR